MSDQTGTTEQTAPTANSGSTAVPTTAASDSTAVGDGVNGEKTKKTISVSSIQVNPCQRGNPILKEIRNVPWEFVEGIVPDYILGANCVALFLSLRYFTLQPNYIHDRLKALGSGSKLRVLLVLIDQKDPHYALNKLMRISILSELTLMLAWNNYEAAKVLETYKLYENKPPDMIMEQSGTQVHEKIAEALTSVKSINKTDASTLIGYFGTLEKMVAASIEDLSLCPGFGPEKAQRLYKVLHENFKRQTSST